VKRRQSEKDKKLTDDARLMRWWKAWHREQRDEALAKHPYLAELFRLHVVEDRGWCRSRRRHGVLTAFQK